MRENADYVQGMTVCAMQARADALEQTRQQLEQQLAEAQQAQQEQEKQCSQLAQELQQAQSTATASQPADLQQIHDLSKQVGS